MAGSAGVGSSCRATLRATRVSTEESPHVSSEQAVLRWSLSSSVSKPCAAATPMKPRSAPDSMASAGAILAPPPAMEDASVL